MLVVPTELRPSKIHGVGVFLLVPIKKDELIWRFDSRIDRVYSNNELLALPVLVREHIEKHGNWHKTTGLWMLCGDYAKHINHSDHPTTVSLGVGFSDDIAARDLSVGEELTTDYRLSCDRSLSDDYVV